MPPRGGITKENWFYRIGTGIGRVDPDRHYREADATAAAAAAARVPNRPASAPITWPEDRFLTAKPDALGSAPRPDA